MEHLPEGEGERGQKGQLKEADDLTLDHAASHLAVAMTISTLLRSIPHHAAKRVNVIPLEVGKLQFRLHHLDTFSNQLTLESSLTLASRHNLQEESLFRKGPSTPGLQDCVATLAGIAQAELRTARECFDGTTGVPKRATPVFLSAVRFNCPNACLEER